MSVDEPTVEDKFLDTIVNGSCADIYQLCAGLGDLVLAGHNLSDFIVGVGRKKEGKREEGHRDGSKWRSEKPLPSSQNPKNPTKF